MCNKRSLASEEIAAIPDEKRFRHDMVDVFLNNELSSARSARLLHNAAMAGKSIRRAGMFRGTCSENASEIASGHQCMNFQCLGGTKPSNVSSNINWPCCCPTNLLRAFLKLHSVETMLANQQNVLPERPDLLSHLVQLQQMGLNPDEVLLTRIWSDGVPFNSDRSQPLETISLNIFGDDSARLPLTAFPK